MELGPVWAEAGLWGLFMASFLAATILPFSSEALLGIMAAGAWSSLSLLLAASIGNTLGGLTNYGLGRWVPEEKLMGRLRIDTAKADRWRGLVHRYGAWAALLCWLPVIGDPIAIALGLFRAPLLPSVALMFIGKTARYAVLLGILRGGLGW
ncbi:MAG TPA: YqaA family protein [Flavobacteriales bacterium]|nr:YqaA family protein [Flavobacteriales bacterium]